MCFSMSRQVGLRNLIFQAEVVEQRFRARMLPHHDQQASDDQNQTEHGRMLPSNMLLLNLIPLIDVTFSTPTPVTTVANGGIEQQSVRPYLCLMAPSAVVT